MIQFELEIGGVIKIYSMDAEQAGKIEFAGVPKFVKRKIMSGVGLQGLFAVQEVKGKGNVSIPSDMRFVLDNENIGYEETKTKGFTETKMQPISSDLVR